jgi:hypothetical protein
MLLKLYNNKFKVFIEHILIICLVAHIFFWDSFQFIDYKINFFGLNFLNFKITIIIIFFYYLFNNYKSFLKKNLNLFFIFSLLLFHLLLNYDHNFFIYKKIFKFFIIFSIFVVCNNYYNFIVKNLEKIIFLFLIIIFGVLIYDLFDNNFLNNLKGKDIKFYLLFSENSHFAIMVVPTIFFLIFNKKGQFSFYSLLGLMTAFIAFFLFYSTSLVLGLLLVLLFSFVFCFNEFLKKIFSITVLVIVCISSLYLSEHLNINKKNFFKDNKIAFLISIFTESQMILNSKSLILKPKDNIDVQREYFYDKRCAEPITNKNYSDKWKKQNENIGTFFINNEICLPLKKIEKLDLLINKNRDITIAVFLNSAQVTFFSVKEKFYGYGLNNYESSFAKQMVNNVVPIYLINLSTFGKEIYFLNYNDASSNLLKLICEFGIFNALFFFVFMKYILSKKILIGHKLFFASIILVQFLRGAGYANGGFAFGFAMMLTHFFYNTTIPFFKKN